MTSCIHPILVLLPEKKNMLRCQHCHLKIKADELEESYCPECFEIHRKKQYDFEEIADTDAGISKYRCEKCGVIIESE
jgi:predicted RNA-binding Zn-ribbon protein involved in translation (DUF1610 family)